MFIHQVPFLFYSMIIDSWERRKLVNICTLLRNIDEQLFRSEITEFDWYRKISLTDDQIVNDSCLFTRTCFSKILPHALRSNNCSSVWILPWNSRWHLFSKNIAELFFSDQNFKRTHRVISHRYYPSRSTHTLISISDSFKTNQMSINLDYNHTEIINPSMSIFLESIIRSSYVVYSSFSLLAWKEWKK